MKSTWYPAEDSKFIGKFKCIENKVSKEIEINSPNGFIWPTSDGYAMVITNPRLARKILPESHWPVNFDDEVLYRFGRDKLDFFCTALKIKKNRKAMIARANNFGE